MQSLPVELGIRTSEGLYNCGKSGNRWSAGSVLVEIIPEPGETLVSIEAPGVELLNVYLRFSEKVKPGYLCLGDHWERAYGDLEWRGIVPDRPLPWYFILTGSEGSLGVGVKTGGRAFCCWKLDPKGYSLDLDLRNGGRGVRLGTRRIEAARIVRESYSSDIPVFAAASMFCRSLCERPSLPKHLVYGGNNWYSAYGKSCEAEMIMDTETIADATAGLPNRPYMVIDDGWQMPDPNHPEIGPGWAGGYNWRAGNKNFPDMPGMIRKMKELGVRPGIWFRPLAADPSSHTSMLLPKKRILCPDASSRHRAFLDPTNSESQKKIAEDIQCLVSWGCELIKHDFSCWDLFGRYGNHMGASVSSGNWSFHDTTKTNAEIVIDFYQLIRRSAGDHAIIIACNTFSHLSAGIFEIQRTGDDTSGREWGRTRQMGVNALAFRMPQHNAFYVSDADCVGLTKLVPWEKNSQWLDLLAESGTPLFVSAARDAITPSVRSALKEAFAKASAKQSPGEALDWTETTCPSRWRLNGKTREFDWY